MRRRVEVSGLLLAENKGTVVAATKVAQEVSVRKGIEQEVVLRHFDSKPVAPNFGGSTATGSKMVL